MDAVLPIICFIAGLVAGILVYRLIAGRGDRDTAERLETLQRDHERRTADLRAEYDRRAEDLRRETIAQFRALSAEMLALQTTGLKDANAEQIQVLLQPLTENIASFRKTVTDTHTAETASREALKSQIDMLMRLNQSIGAEARNLTSALKGNSKVQGDWGEMILETMLQNAGLQEGIHYVSQQTRDESGVVLRGEGGGSLRPDVVVNMPDRRKLVIDSKVSLTAFAEYCGAEGEEERATLLKRNLASVRAHIDELAAKRYQEVIKGSADHVMMFIPNEGAYIAAIQSDPALWEYAYKRKVALVSPTHLFSVMKIVSQLWVQDKQNRNTAEIARVGGRLYDKIAGYVEALTDVGTKLQAAQVSYDKALGRLSTGHGNMMSTAARLTSLGARATKSIPTDLLPDPDTPDTPDSDTPDPDPRDVTAV